VRLCGGGGRDHLLVRVRRRAVADVLGDGGVEELRLLRDDADVRVQGLERERGVVDAAEGEPPFRGVVVPEQQVDHRALAAAALADEGADGALVDGEAHAAQHLLLRPHLVGEAHALEGEVPPTHGPLDQQA